MTEARDMTKLLEASVLPLMAEMIKAMGEHSYRYESYIKEVKEKIGGVESSTIKEEQNKEEILEKLEEITEYTNRLNESSTNQEDAFNILTTTITTFGEKLTDLIDTNNQLISYQKAQTEYQKVQTEKMEDITLAFEENTARLSTLILAIEDSDTNNVVEECLETDISEDEDSVIENEEIVKSDAKPIHKVLEDEINRLRNNTKG